MKEIVEKLVQAEREMATEKGPFLLFALFLREEAPDVWDLVVASPWTSTNNSESLRYISAKTTAVLEPSELVKLSRIVLVEPDSPALAPFHQAIRIEHGIAEIKDSSFSGLPIKRAYLITSQRAVDIKSPHPAKRAT